MLWLRCHQHLCDIFVATHFGHDAVVVIVLAPDVMRCERRFFVFTVSVFGSEDARSLGVKIIYGAVSC